MTEKDTSVKSLLKVFFPLAWMGHIGLGLMYGMMGPARPYLARAVNVNDQAISLLWSTKAAGTVIACLTTGPAFGTNFMNPSNRKLIVLGSTLSIVAMCLVVAPFLTSYLLLMSLYGFMCFGSGSFDLMDNGLMGMMLGPETSRPFVQSLHAFAAVGFALIAVVMPYFLPSSVDASEEICAQLANPNQNITEDTIGTLIEDSWPILTRPFWIVGFWMLTTGLGLMFLGFKNFKLPDFNPEKPIPTTVQIQNSPEDEKDLSSKLNVNKKREHVICWLVGLLIYFEVSLEMVFHSFSYTYGLCGPVKMTPIDAGWLNSIFFITFTFGRICSIPLSTFLNPGTILVLAHIGTFTSIAILVLFESLLGYYIAFGIAGFFVCFCFGSTITFLTNNTPSMKSRPMSFIFMGASLAGCISPPLASYAFDQEPIYVFYLCMIYQSVSFGLLVLGMIIARGGTRKNLSKDQNAS